MSFQEGFCPSCHHDQHVGAVCRANLAVTPGTFALCGCTSEAAIKADAGKPKGFRLLAWDAIEEIVEVYNYGIRKGYLKDSWRQVKLERYEDALVRHLIAHFKGTERDEESGLRHVAHLAWNALALVVLSRGR